MDETGENPTKAPGSLGQTFDIASIYKNIQQKLRDVKDASDDSEVTQGPQSKLPDNETVAASTSESETHSDSKVVTSSVSQPCEVSVVSLSEPTETEVASGSIPLGLPSEIDEDTSVPVSASNSCSANVSIPLSHTADNVAGAREIADNVCGTDSLVHSQQTADLPASHNTEGTEPQSASEEVISQDIGEEMDMETDSARNTSSAQHETVFIKQEREDDYESFGDIVIKQEKEDQSYEQHAYGGDPSLFVVKRERRDSALSEDDDVVFNGCSYRLPDDSDSDTSSLSSFDTVTSELPPPEMSDFQNVKKAFQILRTNGEIFPEELPPLENLHISLPEETKLEELGVVTGIVGVLVVVESTMDLALYSPLNDDSVLFFENKQPLGVVFEVFGPCKAPAYSVRFNSPKDIEDKGIEIGLKVFFVPKPVPEVGEITHYVFVQKLKQLKGSDASWTDNNEPPVGSIDYSDDEEERRARAKRKADRRANAADADTNKSNSGDTEAKEKPAGKKRRGRKTVGSTVQHQPYSSHQTDNHSGVQGSGRGHRQFNMAKKSFLSSPIFSGPGTPAEYTGYQGGRWIRPPPPGSNGPPCGGQGPPRFPPRPRNPWFRPMSGPPGPGAASGSSLGHPWPPCQNNSVLHGPATSFPQSQWNGPFQGNSVGSRPPFSARANIQSQSDPVYSVGTSVPPPTDMSYHDFDRPASDAHTVGWPPSQQQSGLGYGSHNPHSAPGQSAQDFSSHVGAGPFSPPQHQPRPRFQGRPHFVNYHNGQH